MILMQYLLPLLAASTRHTLGLAEPVLVALNVFIGRTGRQDYRGVVLKITEIIPYY
jgi:hypothetical protein